MTASEQRLPGWSVFLVLLVPITSFISRVSGLSCVQCVSVDVPSCLHGHITPSPCLGMDHGSKYCIKSVGSQVSGHGQFVSRGCSKSLQTNCTQAMLDGDLYNVCHNSCIHDGCNQAPTRTCLSFNYSILTLVAITAAFCSRYIQDWRH